MMKEKLREQYPEHVRIVIDIDARKMIDLLSVTDYKGGVGGVGKSYLDC